LLVVIAILHTIGNFAPRPPDPAEAPLLAAMRAYRAPLGLWQPTALDIHRDFALTMTILLLWIGAANLAVAAWREATDALVRRQALLSALGVGALAVASWVFRVPPPFFSFVVAEVVFLAALLRRPGPNAT